MHSVEDEIEITSGGSSCDAVPGLSDCSGVGMICTWHITFLLRPWSSMLLIGIALPNFPVSVPILVLVQRRHGHSNSSGVRLVSNFFAAGLIGDGVFLVGSESDDSDIDVSHSNC